MATGTRIEIDPSLLRRLHRIHRQRTDLRSQLERGPRQIAAGEALVAEAEAKLAGAREALRKAKRAADEKQLQLQSREAHIEQLKAKLNSASSNKEYSLLKEQIAADEQANSVQSDEILEALEHIDTLEQDVAAAEAELERQRREHAARVEEVEERLQNRRQELERIETELAEAEAEIPAAARRDYDRVTAVRGEEALAPVEGDSCSGCYQTLTTQVMNQLRLSQLTRCPSCSAFLYLPEDRRVQSEKND